MEVQLQKCVTAEDRFKEAVENGAVVEVSDKCDLALEYEYKGIWTKCFVGPHSVNYWRSLDQKAVRRAIAQLKKMFLYYTKVLGAKREQLEALPLTDDVKKQQLAVQCSLTNKVRRVTVFVVEEGVFLMLDSDGRTRVANALQSMFDAKNSNQFEGMYRHLWQLGDFMLQCKSVLCRAGSYFGALARLCFNYSEADLDGLHSFLKNSGTLLNTLKELRVKVKSNGDDAFMSKLKTPQSIVAAALPIINARRDMQSLLKCIKSKSNFPPDHNEFGKKKIFHLACVLLDAFPLVFGQHSLISFDDSVSYESACEELMTLDSSSIRSKFISKDVELHKAANDCHVNGKRKRGAEVQFAKEGAKTPHLELRIRKQVLVIDGVLMTIDMMEKLYIAEKALSESLGKCKKAVKTKPPPSKKLKVIMPLTVKVDKAEPKPSGTEKSKLMRELKQLNFKNIVVRMKSCYNWGSEWAKLQSYGRGDLLIKYIGSDNQNAYMHHIVKDIVCTPSVFKIRMVDKVFHLRLRDAFEKNVLDKDAALRKIGWAKSARKYCLKPLKPTESEFYWMVQTFVDDMVQLKNVGEKIIRSKAFEESFFKTLVVDQLLPLTDLNGSNMGWVGDTIYRYDLNLSEIDEAHATRRLRGLATAQRLKKPFLDAFERELDRVEESDARLLVGGVFEKLGAKEGEVAEIAAMREKLYQFASATELGCAWLDETSSVKAVLKLLCARARVYPSKK